MEIREYALYTESLQTLASLHANANWSTKEQLAGRVKNIDYVSVSQKTLLDYMVK